jgi:N-acetylglucosamine-6-phosphate deacetylase
VSRPLFLKGCRRYDDPEGGPLDVLLAEGRIASFSAARDDVPDYARCINAEGLLVAPGLIDVHIHGAGGSDASEATEEAISTMARTLAHQGTTGFLATVFAPPSDEHPHLRALTAAVGKHGGALLLGLHVEGPFLNPERRGGIPLNTIYPASDRAVEALLEACDGHLRMMTIAPELEGHLDAIRRLEQAGVITSFGHSDATYRQTLEAFDAGLRHVTHLYNAMRPLHHREPGPLVAIFEREDVTVQLIADGVHIAADLLPWTYSQLGPSRSVLITDGMHGTGLPDGQYMFNGREYEAREGVARYLDGTLIGTTLGLAEVVRRFRQATGCTLRDAIDCASKGPARVLGLEAAKGSLAVGMDADLILIDDDINVRATVVAGEVVYDRSPRGQ